MDSEATAAVGVSSTANLGNVRPDDLREMTPAIETLAFAN